MQPSYDHIQISLTESPERMAHQFTERTQYFPDRAGAAKCVEAQQGVAGGDHPAQRRYGLDQDPR